MYPYTDNPHNHTEIMTNLFERINNDMFDQVATPRLIADEVTPPLIADEVTPRLIADEATPLSIADFYEEEYRLQEHFEYRLQEHFEEHYQEHYRYYQEHYYQEHDHMGPRYNHRMWYPQEPQPRYYIESESSEPLSLPRPVYPNRRHRDPHFVPARVQRFHRHDRSGLNRNIQQPR